MERIRLRRSTLIPLTHDADAGEPHPERSHRLTTDEMKHNFVVRPAREPAFGSPREVLCTCVRCKWTFQVSPDTGSIAALDNVGELLEGANAERRIATFAEGLCPAFANFPEYREFFEKTEEPHPIREALQPLLHLLGLDRSA